jgi:hypothetical protein
MKWPRHPNLRKRPHAPSKGRGPIQVRIRRAFAASGADVLTSSAIYDWAHVRRRLRRKSYVRPFAQVRMAWPFHWPGARLSAAQAADSLSDPHTSRAWRLSSIMRLPWRKVIGVPGQR